MFYSKYIPLCVSHAQLSILIIHKIGSVGIIVLLRPSTKLRQGNVFTGVCDSVHRGEGVSLRETHVQTETPLDRDPQTETPWTETPWTETTLDRDSPGQRPPPRQRPHIVLLPSTMQLRQGNIFTGIYDSVHRGRGVSVRETPSRQRPPWTETPWKETPRQRPLDREHPGHRPPRTENTPDIDPLDRDPQTETPPPPDRDPPVRAVRILLECILV